MHNLRGKGAYITKYPSRDEARYLWPQHQRSHSSPELVDWVNTPLVNQQVPVALICTDQFAKLKARVEKRTGWTSEQLEHRVKR